MAQAGPMRVPVLVLVFLGFGAAWAPGRAQDALVGCRVNA